MKNTSIVWVIASFARSPLDLQLKRGRKKQGKQIGSRRPRLPHVQTQTDAKLLKSSPWIDTGIWSTRCFSFHSSTVAQTVDGPPVVKHYIFMLKSSDWRSQTVWGHSLSVNWLNIEFTTPRLYMSKIFFYFYIWNVASHKVMKIGILSRTPFLGIKAEVIIACTSWKERPYVQ